MNDLLKWSTKVAVSAVFWVFVLSIRQEGRPIFYHVNNLLVQNTIVRTLDEGLTDVWDRLRRAAKVAFAQRAPGDAKGI